MKQIDGTMYFTVEELACLLGITVRTVQRWLSEPENKPSHAPNLTPYVFPDGRKYFKQQEIQEAYARVLGSPLSNNALADMLRTAQAETHRALKPSILAGA